MQFDKQGPGSQHHAFGQVATSSVYEGISIDDSRAMPVMIVQEQPNNRMHSRSAAAIAFVERIPRPIPGSWGSGICDWSSNLYPSCYCTCCCMHGMYIMGQMAERHECGKFNTIVSLYVLTWLFAIILELRQQKKSGAILFWIPCIFSIFISVCLRLHIVKKYNIRNATVSYCSQIQEFMEGLLCCPCSTSQMARYTYGYVRVLDGDARLDRADSYLV